MSAKHHSDGTDRTVTAAASELVLAVGLLGGTFALLFAASYPVLVAAAAAGAVSAALVREGARRVASVRRRRAGHGLLSADGP